MKAQIVPIAAALAAFSSVAIGCANDRPANDASTTTVTAADIGVPERRVTVERPQVVQRYSPEPVPAPQAPPRIVNPEGKADNRIEATSAPPDPHAIKPFNPPAPVLAPPANAPRTAPLVVENPGAHDRTPKADNTAINDRDRHGAATPGSQGNSASEIEITAAIRRAVVANKSLSFGAKNVKIITSGNKVTLRGPVKTDEEKTTVENLARQVAGVDVIDNQLEVKSK